MAPPVELVSFILAELWAYPFTTEERINVYRTCNLISKQWSAIFKDVNSVHAWIPFSFDKAHLYTVRSMHIISNPMLCRTITFTVEYVVMPQLLIWYMTCGATVEANKRVESALRRIFCDPNRPRSATHIYVNYLDDLQLHTPSFWIPPQITHLTIVYHYRRWVPRSFRKESFTFHCVCERLAVDRRVSHLTVMGAIPAIVKRLIAPRDEWRHLVSLTTDLDETSVSASSQTSVVCKRYDIPFQDVGNDYALHVMFGDRSFWLYRPYHGRLPLVSLSFILIIKCNRFSAAT
ncbi:uncharacterized protein EV420DRAFT_1552982 [Desarmillaria tabescens]|uniref:Uncharacterized protein n=1 Tax=Armillaria tabescens TaxID=1929756 RepID=A0AA39N2P3_ARMTA|nr:uncharacterized protein EV420DRAFT_1552982 [Desarmillaria tabescens]KAK0455747.1 hypothetical protein EV420DRAFT_1552982 [Desarmillaria tabescens]